LRERGGEWEREMKRTARRKTKSGQGWGGIVV